MTDTDLKMFHENGDDDVDEYKLSHQNEDHKEHWSDDRVDTAVTYTVIVRVTVVLQRVLTTTHKTHRFVVH